MGNWMTPFLCPYVSVLKINRYIWEKRSNLKSYSYGNRIILDSACSLDLGFGTCLVFLQADDERK